jgi:hypothetical protein
MLEKALRAQFLIVGPRVMEVEEGITQERRRHHEQELAPDAETIG